MGWLFYTDPSRVQGYAGEKAEITRLCTHENEDTLYEALQVSKVGSTWYAAVKQTSKLKGQSSQTTFVTAEDRSYVFAVVFLVRYDEGCFGYKIMDETMGPVEARAPKSLLKRLSPLKEDDSDSYKWASTWRAKCAAWASVPTYEAGDVIELGTPIPLPKGGPIKTVRKDTYRRRGKNMPVYIDVETGARWRLNRADFVGSKLVETAVANGSSILAEFEARRRKAG